MLHCIVITNSEIVKGEIIQYGIVMEISRKEHLFTLIQNVNYYCQVSVSLLLSLVGNVPAEHWAEQGCVLLPKLLVDICSLDVVLQDTGGWVAPCQCWAGAGMVQCAKCAVCCVTLRSEPGPCLRQSQAGVMTRLTNESPGLSGTVELSLASPGLGH